MKLIDADALWTDIMMLPHNGDMISSEEVEQAIKDALTVDAVEVVRCKECKWWKRLEYEGRGLCKAQPFTLDDDAVDPITERMDFCSYGERRDDG